MLSHRRKTPPTVILDARVLGGLAGAAVLLAALSFLLGRWSASIGAHPPAPAVAAQPEPEPIEVHPGAIENDLSFLDRVEKDRQEGAPAAAPETAPTQEAAAHIPQDGPRPGPSPPPPEEAPAREAPARADATPPPPRADSHGYLIQVFASESRSRAEAVRDRLVARGYPASVVSTEIRSKTYYRVRVGPYLQKSRATTVAERLEGEESLRTWIIKP